MVTLFKYIFLKECFRWSQVDDGRGDEEDEAAAELGRGWHAKRAMSFPLGFVFYECFEFVTYRGNRNYY